MTAFRGQIFMSLALLLRNHTSNATTFCTAHKQMHSVSRRLRQMKRNYSVETLLQRRNQVYKSKKKAIQKSNLTGKEKGIQSGKDVNILAVFDTAISKV